MQAYGVYSVEEKKIRCGDDMPVHSELQIALESASGK
jgi:hypothetical protein